MAQAPKGERKPAAKRRPASAAAHGGAVAARVEPVANEATEVVEASVAAPAEAPAWTPSAGGWIARRVVLGAIVAGAVLAPIGVGNVANQRAISLALIYVIVGLSVNMLMGYLGQISLGHQAFVGVGSFTAALMATKANAPFFLTLVGAGAVGAAAAVMLGVVALRLKGLYLALITLAYGTVAQNTIFNTPAITGGGAGVTAARPGFIESDKAFIYFVMAFVVAALYLDWRFVKSKAGRAVFAIRENELAAASFGINVTAYKLIAFVLSGTMAGVAGALFGYYVESVDAGNYDFGLALTFVLMVVVGGLGSRTGVFIGSAFFALIGLLLESLFGTGFGHTLTNGWHDLPFLYALGVAVLAGVGMRFAKIHGHMARALGGVVFAVAFVVFEVMNLSRMEDSFIQKLELYPQFIGAVLLLMTLTLYPGGIAQQIRPFTNWLGGKRLREHGSTVTIHEGGAGVRP